MAPSERGRALRPVVLEYLSKAWRQPDEGLWEVRGGPQHFVHSKVMAWVAFDRAANEDAAGEFDEPPQRWREIANRIMPKSVSAVSTAILTALCRPTALSGSMPAC